MRLIYYGQKLQIIKRKKRDARLPSSSMTNGTKVYWSWGRLPEYQEHSTPQTKEMELQTISEMIKNMSGKYSWTKKIRLKNLNQLLKKISCISMQKILHIYLDWSISNYFYLPDIKSWLKKFYY